jgi:predicted TIM-barrel fold metal-dependent hydrolase
MAGLVISADSHVVEPLALWTESCSARFRDRVPRLARDVDGRKGSFVVCEDALAMPLSAFCSAGLSAAEMADAFAADEPAVRKGGFEPAARLADMARDGVAAEVLYPSVALQVFRVRDAALQAECFRIYNDWLAAFCAAAPERLFGVGLVSLFDVAAAVRAVERAAADGLRGVMVWAAPPLGDSYALPTYEPFWRAAEEARLPVSLHLGTTQDLTAPGESIAVAFMMTILPVQRALAQLVLGGVLERHPGLRIVSVENEVGWLPHFLARLDRAASRYREVAGLTLRCPPGETFRRQVSATFQEDRIGIAARHQIGVDCLMWASDYPHSDSTWPHSQAVIARDFADVPDDERDRITAGNVARLYGITHPR